MSNNTKFTHTVWAGSTQPVPETENQSGTERLLDAGEGWIDKDNVAHLRIESLPLEGYFTGTLQLTPRGKSPVKMDVSR